MKLKSNDVDISRLHPLIKSKLPYIDDIFKEFGEELVITSGNENDPVHKEDSKHYIWNNPSGYGQALDIRNRTIPGDIYKDVLERIEYFFPRPHYRVLDEGDHLHIGLYQEIIEPAIPRRIPKKIDIEYEEKLFETIKLGKVKVPYLYKHKRVIGIVLTYIGMGVGLWNPVAGNLITNAGIGVAGIGLAHSAIKNHKTGKQDDIVRAILNILKALWSVMVRLIGRK